MFRTLLALFLVAADQVNPAEITVNSEKSFTIINPFFEITMEGTTLGTSHREITPAFHIHLSGEISEGDTEKLKTVFSEVAENLPFHYGIMSFDSPGGSFAESLKLGDFIHGRALPTYVFAGHSCLSACAIALSAGSEMLLRNLPPEPARHVEIGSNFGFHAPFIPKDIARRAAEAEVSKGNPPVDTALSFANQMFSISRNITRQINDRSEPWGLAPSLISEFLGYGPEEFYRIDNVSKAWRSNVTLFVRSMDHPTQLTWADAFRACKFRLYAHLGEFYDKRPGFLVGPANVDASTAEPVPFFNIPFGLIEPGPLGSDKDMRRDTGTIEIDHFISGRGNFLCRLSRERSGHWSVDIVSGDFHRDRAFGERTSDTGPLKINEFIAAGPAGPLGEASYGEAIRAHVDKRLGIRFPEVSDEVDVAPSYSCSGNLTKAEQLICDTPTLAYLDSLMAKEFVRARKENPATGAIQRDWLTARDEVCQTELADLQLEVPRVNQLGCLAGAMISQIEVLQDRRFD